MDIVLPHECAGCGRGGVRLCAHCRRTLRQPPGRTYARLSPPVPVWSFGPHAGPHRGVIIALKARGRHDMVEYLARVYTAGLTYLAARGELPEPEELVLVPAPSRRSARAGGTADVVAQIADRTQIPVAHCVGYRRTVRDSVGMSLAARKENAQRNLVIRGELPAAKPVLLIDDVITTGATLQTTAMRLIAEGVNVVGALTFSAAG
ncbi:hypothetical protein CAQU_02910 [Corynebacterium aquilae DSM 44791]|uniref:Uncharacterized protein n=1 Tax=Corynebacterium aquilae DSM 44791 TaxID=1431546 RepID=A0A1L7CEE6_9CORY|nr:hypothetical protein CAQU_02910 [Corynebacterium aquilae DSM 44791]